MRTRTAIALLALAAWSPPSVWADIGLAARFGDVILEGARPGRTYDLKEAAHVPFGIENRGDAEIEVVVEFDRPRKGTLSKDYEEIPDPSWMKAVPERLRIPAKGVGFFDLLLSVPDDRKLEGRHFQVNVKAVGAAGLFGVAVENRVRFSVGPGPESLKAEKKKKAMQQLDFDVTPSSLFLTEVPVGRSWDSRKEGRKAVRVANYARDALKVRMTVEKWDAGVPLPEGCDAIPDPSWIKVKTPEMTVSPDEIVQTGFVLEVPDEAKYRGKRWAALVRTGLTTGFWLDAPVKLIVETQP
jgi:hypothetical protein